jgi:Domain of unknown function (DUF7014)
MSRFMRIFDVFSARPEASLKPTHDVPTTTRNRVLRWTTELYSNRRSDHGVISRGDYNGEFWAEIERRILFRTGRGQLGTSGDVKDVFLYLHQCSGKEFLDFLEDIFSAPSFFDVSFDDHKLVDEINGLLGIDNLPYHMTRFLQEEVQETAGRTVIYTREYPKVIMKESQTLHASSTEPALTLLQRPHFRTANGEYLAALKDYRDGDFGDCLTKCGSAFESVLKIICDRKGWAYQQTDTASTLIKIVLPKTKLDTYFEPLLLIVATLRNRLSSSHGAGTATKQPPRHLAQYALNATASLILLVAQETGEG